MPPNTPAVLARAKKNRDRRSQAGTIVSYTTVRHPPAGFAPQPRRIAVIALADGTLTIGVVTGDEVIAIGQTVLPRLRLNRVSHDGLRGYDIAYEPVATVREPLQTPFPGYILALTGPSGVGKSSINLLLATVLSDQVAPVPIVTTREPKAHDGTEYRYVTTEEFQSLREQGQLATWADIPSQDERRLYGYVVSDIEAIWQSGKIPSVVTEMHLLQGLAQHYGRRSILSCGLLPPGRSRRKMLSTLLHRLRHRGRDTEQSIRDRVRNAEADLRFFADRADLFDHLIVNEHLDGAVEQVKGIVLELVKA